MNTAPSPAHDSLSLAALLRVDAACRRFEAACKAGLRPCLEDYLAAAQGAEREELRAELLLLAHIYDLPPGDPLAGTDPLATTPEVARGSAPPGRNGGPTAP